MSFLEKEISMIISSDTTNGATNKSSDGSRFEIALENGLQIPNGAQNCALLVENATVWNTVANVITGENDRITVNGIDTSDAGATYVITLPQGLYDLAQINSTIEYMLRDAGGKYAPTPMISFTANEASSKVELHVNYGGVQVDFSAARTIGQLLGFTSATYGDYAAPPETVLAPNIAQLNTVDYFLIHSDLTGTGIRVNNKYSQTIAQVLIDQSPGSQIISEPNHPPKVACPHLIGSDRTHMRFWITDQSNEPINTAGENWSLRIVIKYSVPMVIH